MPTFIDDQVRVLEGEEAARRLAEKNDLAFLSPDRGVARVPEERWQEAQRYERTTWMERHRWTADDRNREHARYFDGYRALESRRFTRAIELGAGPFTNMRLILERASAREVHLLDPLVASYLGHPMCRYRDGRLGGLLRASSLRIALSRLWPSRQLAEASNAARVGGLRGRPLSLHATTIESFAPGQRFDLVVMINVLEHCRDADQVLAKVDEILAPNGVFVFHDDLVSSAQLRDILASVYDAGHPLRVDRSVIELFLGRFAPILRTEVQRGEVTALYFIGEKR